MAATSLLILLDDIASVLDDVSTMTKVAVKKTAGVLGDDLALNAQQVSGVPVRRELPVVWAVAKGSLRNKTILVPAALLIAAFAAWAITPLLMLGGAYLCFEGFEKLAHRLLPQEDEKEDARRAAHAAAIRNPAVDVVEAERQKIKGAVRTDFILSAEIIAITLGAVAGAAYGVQVAVLIGIALLMTIGVYGLVAGIVKLDDLGLLLSRQSSRWAQAVGLGIVRSAPYLMKALTVVGTAAMFMVGGSILVHGISALTEWIGSAGDAVAGYPGGAIWSVMAMTLLNALVGVLAGAVLVVARSLVARRHHD